MGNVEEDRSSVRKGRFTIPEWLSYVVLAAVAFLGFFRLQGVENTNHGLINQVKALAEYNHTNSQETLNELCVDGNVLRTNIREYIIAVSLAPLPINPSLQQTDPSLYNILEESRTNSAAAAVTEANKQFADLNCSSISGVSSNG